MCVFMRIRTIAIILIPILWVHSYANVAYSLVFHVGGNSVAVPTEEIDSITFPANNPSALIALKSGKEVLIPSIDSIKVGAVSDTLFLHFEKDHVTYSNPHLGDVYVNVDNCDVEIRSLGMPSLVVSASGECPDGRIKMDADTTCTLRFSNLNLMSSHAPTFNMVSKNKLTVELADGTINRLSDADQYVFNDTTEESNGCLNSLGHIDFVGSGKLIISGRNKHAISSKKGIRFKEGNIDVDYAKSDAIHSGKYISLEGSCLSLNGQAEDGLDADDDVQISDGKIFVCEKGTDFKAIKCGGSFQQTGGSLEIKIIGDAGKGIKAKKDIIFRGGTITALSEGGVVIEDGDPSFCSIIKGDSSIEISGGKFFLINNSDGGKCISCDGSMIIDGGEFDLQTNGNGAGYINDKNEQDYYTPKCITAEDTIRIQGGDIHCISTGLGGKGIVAGKTLSIGNLQGMEEPIIKVETKGTCILDNVDEDKRYGCPKGIKADNYIEVINGHVNVSTKGQGGEGLECKGTIKTYNATIVCKTFDDGINVGQHLSVNGTNIFCHSINNDGIDSNGKISINDGILVSISEHEGDESFDSETGRLYIYGGTVLGVGNDWAKVRESEQPVYTTTIREAIEAPLVLHKDKYLAVGNEEHVILSLYIPYETDNAFITCSSPLFYDNCTYKLLGAEKVINEDCELFDGWLKFNGEPLGYNILKEITPTVFNY